MRALLPGVVGFILLLTSACTTTAPNATEGSATAEASSQPGSGAATAAGVAPNAANGSGTDAAYVPPLAVASASGARPFRATTADEAVAIALVAAHEAMVALVTPQTQATADPGVAAIPDHLQPLYLQVGHNIHAELIDCGCVRNPLGGLARRATMWDELVASAPGGRALHFDAGDALFNRVEDPRAHPDGPRATGEITANAIFDAFGAMDVAAMAIGPRDLAFGGAFLADLSRRHEVPLLSANVWAGEELLGDATWLGDAGPLRVGATAVLWPAALPPEVAEGAEVRVTDAVPAAAQAIGLLRQASPALVILFLTGGTEFVPDLLDGLAAVNALPDLVLVSGSSRTMHQPVWVQQVPYVEAGSRGKQLVQLELGLTPPPVRFVGREAVASPAAGFYSTALTSLRSTLGVRQRQSQRDDVSPASLAVYDQTLNSQWARVRELAVAVRDEMSRPDAPTGPQGMLNVRVVDVLLSIAERPDVAAIATAAIEARSAPQGGSTP